MKSAAAERKRLAVVPCGFGEAVHRPRENLAGALVVEAIAVADDPFDRVEPKRPLRATRRRGVRRIEHERFVVHQAIELELASAEADDLRPHASLDRREPR